MILKFIETIEKSISTNPIILSSDVQKHFGPDGKAVYVKGSLLFIDSSSLDIAIFAREIRNCISIDKYRFSIWTARDIWYSAMITRLTILNSLHIHTINILGILLLYQRCQA